MKMNFVLFFQNLKLSSCVTNYFIIPTFSELWIKYIIIYLGNRVVGYTYMMNARFSKIRFLFLSLLNKIICLTLFPIYIYNCTIYTGNIHVYKT